MATAALSLGDPPATKSHADKAVLAAYDVAAMVLGNTCSVCRSCYVHRRSPRRTAAASSTRRGAARGHRHHGPQGECVVLNLLER